ncbi:hypothetical protein QQP08_012896 [Theobroma cacao]|nr:hypothetical protein QQP08_012896 [Theobroma cacao]
MLMSFMKKVYLVMTSIVWNRRQDQIELTYLMGFHLVGR